MTSPQPAPTNPPVAFGDTTLGLLVRLGFFIFTVYVVVRFLIPFLHYFFGLHLTIANALGVAMAGLIAN